MIWSIVLLPWFTPLIVSFFSRKHRRLTVEGFDFWSQLLEIFGLTMEYGIHQPRRMLSARTILGECSPRTLFIRCLFSLRSRCMREYNEKCGPSSGITFRANTHDIACRGVRTPLLLGALIASRIQTNTFPGSS